MKQILKKITKYRTYPGKGMFGYSWSWVEFLGFKLFLKREKILLMPKHINCRCTVIQIEE